VKSLFWTSRYELILLFPLWWVLSFSEIVVVDLEANLFFTVLSFGKNHCFWFLKKNCPVSVDTDVGRWKSCTNIAGSIGKKQINILGSEPLELVQPFSMIKCKYLDMIVLLARLILGINVSTLFWHGHKRFVLNNLFFIFCILVWLESGDYAL